MAAASLGQFFSSSKGHPDDKGSGDGTVETRSLATRSNFSAVSHHMSVFSGHSSVFSAWSSDGDDSSFCDDDSESFHGDDFGIGREDEDFQQINPPQVYFRSMSQRFQTFWKKKSLNFCLEETKYYETPEMTKEERGSYWYTRRSLKLCQAEALLDTKGAFPKSAIGLVLKAYRTCCRAKSEEACKPIGDKVDREALKLIYFEGDGMGLERHVLRLVRGDSKGLCSFTLDQINFSIKRAQHLDLEKRQKVIAHVSQCISRPSRIMAHQMAMAQAPEQHII
jgi:hypothetical protein